MKAMIYASILGVGLALAGCVSSKTPNSSDNATDNNRYRGTTEMSSVSPNRAGGTKITLRHKHEDHNPGNDREMSLKIKESGHSNLPDNEFEWRSVGPEFRGDGFLVVLPKTNNPSYNLSWRVVPPFGTPTTFAGLFDSNH